MRFGGGPLVQAPLSAVPELAELEDTDMSSAKDQQQATAASTEKFINVGGLKLQYNDVGAGDPILGIHGGGPGATAWGNFKQNLPALTKNRRMIMLNMPGFAKSEFPENCTEDFFDLMGRLLSDFLDALDIGRIDIIGNSMGGQAALGLALRNNARIKHLVLIGSQPTAAGIVIQPQPQEALNNIVKYYQGEGATIGKMRGLVESLVYDTSFLTRETLEERFAASMDPGPGQMRLLMLPRRDLYSELGKIACPTLLIWGQEDKGGALEVGLQMLKKFQNARMVIFQRCGHWAQVEHCDEFNRVVLDFFGTNYDGQAGSTRLPRQSFV